MEFVRSAARAAELDGLDGAVGGVFDDELVGADVGDEEFGSVDGAEALAGGGGVALSGGGIFDECDGIVSGGGDAGDELAGGAGGGVADFDDGDFDGAGGGVF